MKIRNSGRSRRESGILYVRVETSEEPLALDSEATSGLVPDAVFISVALGEPSACSVGAGGFDPFDAGARGTLFDFFAAELELGSFVSAIVAEETIYALRVGGKLRERAAVR
jgi:hypothetical protein